MRALYCRAPCRAGFACLTVAYVTLLPKGFPQGFNDVDDLPADWTGAVVARAGAHAWAHELPERCSRDERVRVSVLVPLDHVALGAHQNLLLALDANQIFPISLKLLLGVACLIVLV